MPPILDQIRVAAGYEMALAAALGDDLEAPAAEAAALHWRLNAAAERDPVLPPGAEPGTSPRSEYDPVTRSVVERAQAKAD